MGGMRGVGFAALLGLDNFRKDALATGLHAYLIQRKYPWAEISLSCPRLRPIISNNDEGAMFTPNQNNEIVGERQLLQVISAYRIFLPFAAMTISTRERAGFRDNVMGYNCHKKSLQVWILESVAIAMMKLALVIISLKLQTEDPSMKSVRLLRSTACSRL